MATLTDIVNHLDFALNGLRECEAKLHATSEWKDFQGANEIFEEYKARLKAHVAGLKGTCYTGKKVTASWVVTESIDTEKLDKFLQEHGESVSNFKKVGGYWKVTTKK